MGLLVLDTENNKVSELRITMYFVVIFGTSKTFIHQTASPIYLTQWGWESQSLHIFLKDFFFFVIVNFQVNSCLSFPSWSLIGLVIWQWKFYNEMSVSQRIRMKHWWMSQGRNSCHVGEMTWQIKQDEESSCRTVMINWADVFVSTITISFPSHLWGDLVNGRWFQTRIVQQSRTYIVKHSSYMDIKCSFSFQFWYC